MELFFPSPLSLQFLLYFDDFELMHPYANAIISSFEDPEKILEQGVLDMNNDLIKVCQATTRIYILYPSILSDQFLYSSLGFTFIQVWYVRVYIDATFR